jgi:hypothetical protein
MKVGAIVIDPRVDGGWILNPQAALFIRSSARQLSTTFHNIPQLISAVMAGG